MRTPISRVQLYLESRRVIEIRLVAQYPVSLISVLVIQQLHNFGLLRIYFYRYYHLL